MTNDTSGTLGIPGLSNGPRCSTTRGRGTDERVGGPYPVGLPSFRRGLLSTGIPPFLETTPSWDDSVDSIKRLDYAITVGSRAPFLRIPSWTYPFVFARLDEVRETMVSILDFKIGTSSFRLE